MSSLLSPKLRVAALRYAARGLLGPMVGQIPRRGYLRSIVERMYNPEVARHVEDAVQFIPATVEHYDFPGNFPPEFRRSKAFDERLIYRLRDVVISPHSGLVWLANDGPIIEESYGSLIRSLGWGDIRHEPLMNRQRDMAPTPLVAFAPTGYFHWLLEVLPAALAAVEFDPTVRLLTPTRVPRYVTDAAESLVGRSRIVRCDAMVHADNAVMSTIEPYSGFVQSAQIERIRQQMRPITPAHADLIYVSRLKDTKRALSNEAEIENVMREVDAVVVYAQDMTFDEQRAAFAGARTIVAPHGAGLANLIWTQRAERVIEIFPATFFNDCFARLSRNLDIEYDYIVAAPGGSGGGVVEVDLLRSAI